MIFLLLITKKVERTMKLFKAANAINGTNNTSAISNSDIVRKGILIVDDSRFSRNVLKDILIKENFEIVGEAGDGLEAIEMTKNVNPEYIFMDVEMPKLDGLGAIPKILEVDPGVHIIMCTALGQKKIMVEAAKAGAVDYVIKPYNKENIIGIVNLISSSHPKTNQGNESKPDNITQEDVKEINCYNIKNEKNNESKNKKSGKIIEMDSYDNIDISEIEAIKLVENLMENKEIKESQEDIQIEDIQENVEITVLEEKEQLLDEPEENNSNNVEPSEITGMEPMESLQDMTLGEMEGELVNIKEPEIWEIPIPLDGFDVDFVIDNSEPFHNTDEKIESPEIEEDMDDVNPEISYKVQEQDRIEEDEGIDVKIADTECEDSSDDIIDTYAIEVEEADVIEEIKEIVDIKLYKTEEIEIRQEDDDIQNEKSNESKAFPENQTFSYLWNDRFCSEIENGFVNKIDNRQVAFLNITNTRNDLVTLFGGDNKKKKMIMGMMRAYMPLENRLLQNDIYPFGTNNLVSTGVIRLSAERLLGAYHYANKELSISDLLQDEEIQIQQTVCYVDNKSSLTLAIDELVSGKSNRILDSQA